jgi:hypothetical protein
METVLALWSGINKMNGQITLSRDPYIRANITRSRKEDIVPRYKKITIVLDILQNKYSHKICPKKIWQAARCASCTDPRASCAGGSNSRLLLAVRRLMRNSQRIMRKRQNQQCLWSLVFWTRDSRHTQQLR